MSSIKKANTEIEQFTTFFLIIFSISVSIKYWEGEFFDYIYVVLMILITIIISFLAKRINNQLNIFKYINMHKKVILHLILVVLLISSFHFNLSTLRLAISFLILILIVKLDKRWVATIALAFSLIFFLFELIKLSSRLQDNFHRIFIIDELFLWSNKILFVNYMSQYNGIIGIPLSLLDRNLSLESLISTSTNYLIILQYLAIFFLVIILLVIVEKNIINIALSLIMLMSFLGGDIWYANISTLDLLQEYPSRKIFPIIIVLIYLIMLKKLYTNNRKKIFYFSSYIIGVISAISFLNDFVFSSIIIISMFISIMSISGSIKSKIITNLSFTIGLMCVFIIFAKWIKIDFNQNFLQLIFTYIFQYGETTFGKEFELLSPDIFYFCLVIYAIFSIQLNKKINFKLENSYLYPFTIFIIANLVLASIYWSGRSYSVQINSTAATYALILLTVLLHIYSQEKKLNNFYFYIYIFSIMSPILFNLWSFTNLGNNFNRLFKSSVNEYEPFRIRTNLDLKKDLVQFQNQFEYLKTSYNLSYEKIGIIMEFGNLYAFKYGVSNINIVNNPTSLTNSNQFSLICKNLKETKLNTLLVDYRLNEFLSQSNCLKNNYKVTQDSGAPRLVLLQRII